MNWRPIVPFFFTFGAMVAGVTSILVAASGDLINGAKLIMLSMILDGLDGHLARMLKGTSEFGADLDTFVDIVSFGVAPAFLAWEAGLSEFGVWGMALACSMVMSGASRLARFRVVDPSRGQKGYLGMPITVMAGWVSMVVLVANSDLVGMGWLSLTKGIAATVFWAVVVMFTLLQVSHVRYSKPTKAPLVFVTCVAVVSCLFFHHELAVAAAITICTGMFYYGFISPFLPGPEVETLIEELDEFDDEDEEPLPVRHS